jgi:hypothetical protein
MARLVLTSMAALVLLAALLNAVPQPDYAKSAGRTDGDLYRAVAERVMRGENYYTAAAAEHRARGYPTTPPEVFREPALAWTLAAMPSARLRRAVMIGLSLLVFVTLRNALERARAGVGTRLLAMPLLGSALAIAWIPGSEYIHEIWAGMLIALSLGLYRPQQWPVSVLLALVAALFRELALLYLAAMAASALYERRYREAAGWLSAALLFCALFAWHLSVASHLYRAGDLSTKGWFALQGWPFVLETAKRNLALFYAGNWVVGIAVCLGLLGFAGQRDSWIARAGLVTGSYMAVFLFVGRPDNSYWGMLYSPLLPIGVALSPLALRDLIARAWAPRLLPWSVVSKHAPNLN